MAPVCGPRSDFGGVAESQETLAGTEEEPLPTLPLGRLGGADETLPITLTDRYRIDRPWAQDPWASSTPRTTSISAARWP